MRDLNSNSTVLKMFASQLNAASTSIVGDVIDLKGTGRKILGILNIGSISTNTLTITVYESADNSTYTSLEAIAAKTAAGMTVVDLTPTKRYIRATAVLANTSSVGLANFAMSAVVYNERENPGNAVNI